MGKESSAQAVQATGVVKFYVLCPKPRANNKKKPVAVWPYGYLTVDDEGLSLLANVPVNKESGRKELKFIHLSLAGSVTMEQLRNAEGQRAVFDLVPAENKQGYKIENLVFIEE